jgi:hypothetical protein
VYENTYRFKTAVYFGAIFFLAVQPWFLLALRRNTSNSSGNIVLKYRKNGVFTAYFFVGLMGNPVFYTACSLGYWEQKPLIENLIVYGVLKRFNHIEVLPSEIKDMFFTRIISMFTF